MGRYREVTASAAPIDATALLMREVGFAPVLSSDPQGWPDVRLCQWQGDGRTVRYPAFQEVLLVLHNGRGLWRARRDGRWLDRESVRGQVTVIPPGTPLDWQVIDGIDGWTLQLPPQSFDGLCDDAAGDQLMARVRFDFASDDPLLQATVGALVRELQQPRGFGPRYVAALADTIKLHLLRGSGSGVEAPATRLPRAVLNRVLERIEARIESGVSVDELARLSGCGRSRFTAAFRASTGRSPLQYLRQRRIDLARQRLSGHASLAEIALALGFANQAHFSSRFRAAVGMTPSQFRCAAQAKTAALD